MVSVTEDEKENTAGLSNIEDVKPVFKSDAVSCQLGMESFDDLLRIYYQRFFPYKLFFKWLSYDTSTSLESFQRREFSFTLPQDIYIRFLCYKDGAELEKSMKAKNPIKIDIGAIYNKPPSQKGGAGTFEPVERELVFDIDMTDYDEVRNCCSGAAICPNCWPLMKIAARVLHRALTEDFGFEHILFVYSGRRGIHCWVVDEAARRLQKGPRAALAEYLAVHKGGEKKKKIRLSHPHVEESLAIIKKYFTTFACDGQDFLRTEEQIEKVLAQVLDPELVQQLRKDLPKLSSSRDRWRAVELASQQRRSRAAEQLMLHFCYPRLDIAVTKGMNHLLKSPFSVHPKTGRVCVPIPIENIDKFDPFTVPDLVSLVKELNDGTDCKSTCLSPSIQHFTKFVDGISAASHKGKAVSKETAMEF